MKLKIDYSDARKQRLKRRLNNKSEIGEIVDKKRKFLGDIKNMSDFTKSGATNILESTALNVVECSAQEDENVSVAINILESKAINIGDENKKNDTEFEVKINNGNHCDAGVQVSFDEQVKKKYNDVAIPIN